MPEMPEVQVSIDECVGGIWQGAIYVGSNFVLENGYINGPSFLAVALEIDKKLAELRANWRR